MKGLLNGYYVKQGEKTGYLKIRGLKLKYTHTFSISSSINFSELLQHFNFPVWYSWDPETSILAELREHVWPFPK